MLIIWLCHHIFFSLWKGYEQYIGFELRSSRWYRMSMSIQTQWHVKCLFYTESINRIIFQFHFEYNTCAYSFFFFFFTCVTNPSSKHWTYKIYTIYSFTVISLFCSIACGIVIWQLPFSCCHQSFRLKYHSNLLNFFFISILEHRFRRTYLRTFMSYMLWCSFFSFFSSKQQHWHQKTIRAHTEFIRKIENYSNLWVFQWNTCMCICKMFRLFIISVHMVQSWHQCCYCYLSIYSEILSLSSTAFSFKVRFFVVVDTTYMLSHGKQNDEHQIYYVLCDWIIQIV